MAGDDQRDGQNTINMIHPILRIDNRSNQGLEKRKSQIQKYFMA